MRLLVLGGSVFLSRAAAEVAVSRGHEVTCASRGRTGTVPSLASHYRYDRSAPFPDELRSFDAVLDVARQPSWVAAAVAALPQAHWVFVSSISVYSDTVTPGQTTAAATFAPLFEDVDLSVDPAAYGPMKVACEQHVRQGAESATIVRPGLIVGPGDPTGRFTYWPMRLRQAVSSPVVLAPGSPSDLVQFIDVRDLATWLVDLAEQRNPGTFDAVSRTIPFGAALDQVAAGCWAEPEWEWVPQEFLVSQDVAPWAGPRSLPLWVHRPDLAGLLAHDPTEALASGLQTRPIAETARDTLTWASRAENPATGLTLAEESAILQVWKANRG